jgi:hypothetical protein
MKANQVDRVHPCSSSTTSIPMGGSLPLNEGGPKGLMSQLP